MYMYMYTYIYIYREREIHTYMYTHTYISYTYIYIYIYTIKHIPSQGKQVRYGWEKTDRALRRPPPRGWRKTIEMEMFEISNSTKPYPLRFTRRPVT